MPTRISRWWSVLATFLILSGCGGGGDGSSGTGTLSVTLVDASLPGFSAIYVTVDRIDVHRPDSEGWSTALTPQKTVNLLDLVNGVQEDLGATDLEAGPVNQIRLVLGGTPDASLNILGEPHPSANYFIDDQDPPNYEDLMVPSGLQTGIKLGTNFNIASGGITNIVLDFDAAKSVIMAGASGKFLLKPFIKVLSGAFEVNGMVVDADQIPLEGVLISAQTTDPGAADEGNRVVVVASTLTDAEGGYTLFLNPGIYNLVAYRNAEEITSVLTAFGPGCTTIDLGSTRTLTEDFILSPETLVGEVEGMVNIVGFPPDQHAVLSFRQNSPTCGDNNEILSLNVANGGTYNSIFLPAGSYRLVGSTEGKTSLGVDLTVLYNSAVTGDLNFP